MRLFTPWIDTFHNCSSITVTTVITVLWVLELIIRTKKWTIVCGVIFVNKNQNENCQKPNIMNVLTKTKLKRKNNETWNETKARKYF